VIETIVADTNVVSYLMKGGPLGAEYAVVIRGKVVAISFMTVAELLYGAEIAQWGPARRTKLEELIHNFLILPYEYETCKVWADITAARRRKGKAISCADAWVAACAIQHEIPLVTHNHRDFTDIPRLQLITASSGA
jgi:tRNA(fMet)-specific endonuclease VapC